MSATVHTQAITLTRVFDAPRDLVFRAWTEAEHLAKWWGPQDFTNPVCEIDARLGGRLRIVMRSPVGSEHPMSGTITEFEPGKRLVFDFVAEDAEGGPFLKGSTTVDFEDQDGKTKVTVNSSATGTTEASGQALAGMEMGWSMSLVRLEEFLSNL